MTPNQINDMAERFGLELLTIVRGPNLSKSRNGERRTQWERGFINGVWIAVYAFCSTMEELNPEFDHDGFVGRVVIAANGSNAK